jgi:hypothetical protein
MKFELAKTIAAAAVAGLSSIACGGSTPEPAAPEAPSEAAAATEEAAEAAPASAEAAHAEEATATGAEKACCKAMNECKGKGGCKVEGKHACKNQNECKGQGGCNGHCPQ